jgi:tetratricopeptide (TPR) repeat protein
MKKIFISTLILLSVASGCVFAEEPTTSAITDSVVKQAESTSFKAPKKSIFKKAYTKAWKKIKPDEEKSSVSSQEEMTPSKQATLYYNDGDIEQAFSTILRMSENERSANDWFLLGNILQEKDKISDAIFMYKRAIAVDEDFYKPYYNLGNIYLDDEKPFMAIEQYKHAVKLKTDFSYGYYNMGCAYLQTGNLKKAKLAFIKAVELKNTEPDFHYNLSYTYKRLHKDKLAKEFLDNYNKLINNN